MSIVINARILIMSKFLRVLSTMDLNTLGAKIIGNQNARIKNAVRSKRSCGNVNMGKYSKKVKI